MQKMAHNNLSLTTKTTVDTDNSSAQAIIVKTREKQTKKQKTKRVIMHSMRWQTKHATKSVHRQHMQTHKNKTKKQQNNYNAKRSSLIIAST